MKLEEGKEYTMDGSGLVVRVVNIFFQNDKYIKMKLAVMNKSMGFMYDMKTYKCVKDKVALWKLN